MDPDLIASSILAYDPTVPTPSERESYEPFTTHLALSVLGHPDIAPSTATQLFDWIIEHCWVLDSPGEIVNMMAEIARTRPEYVSEHAKHDLLLLAAVSR